MLFPANFHALWALTLPLIAAVPTVNADNATELYVRINEVADKGSSGTCDGRDWIEIFLPSGAQASTNLSGYILHDDKGPSDEDAFTFGSVIMEPGGYLLLCTGGDDPSESPQFSIGSDDAVTLLDPSSTVVSTTGVLGGRGATDVTYAFDESDGDFIYTQDPTPGEVNIILPLPPLETDEEMRARLAAENAEGTEFFNMDDNGLPVEGGFDEVVDIRMEIDAAVWQKMMEDQSYEIYNYFLNASVTKMDAPEDILLNLGSPGRFRTKGQSTLAYGTCLGRSVPFSIDWDETDANQRLFGMRRSYLRTHLGDPSFVREWSMHRMLARFGLPHLRTRTVRFFANGEYVGLYELMEAPDQDYVFHRSFPDFNPENYALYKVKTLSIGCGLYSSQDVERAEKRLDEMGPYVFEKGEHRPKVPVEGTQGFTQCETEFGKMLENEFEDVHLAYVRAGKKCGEMLVTEGLVDRDLGAKSMDGAMEEFIDAHLADNTCEAKCSNSDLAYDVDVTNFLRNIAVMSAMLHQDSPLGNGNNYYLAHSGAEGSPGWAMVQYDHNGVLSSTSALLCDYDSCANDLVRWSIDRPTCRAFEYNQMAGPLLSDEALHSRYIQYVRDFVNDVMANSTFQQQVLAHLIAIKDEVAKDPWNDFVAAFHLELGDEGVNWKEDIFGPYYPFLPMLRERTSQILLQLEKMDAGQFPRGLDDIGETEACVDWTLDGPRATSCPDGCFYDGCYRQEFTVPAVCDESTGTCFHGVEDNMCADVPDLERYEGMKSNFDGSDQTTFCFYDPTTGPLMVAQCPVKKEVCPDSCIYDGCYREEFTVPAFCDESTGICYHGVTDEKCEGIRNTSSYDGMEMSFEGSAQPTFCFTDDMASPLRMAQCPDKGDRESASPCPYACVYEGCYREEFTVPSFCDVENGICYHGTADEKCEGIPDLGNYEGMEMSFEGSDKPAYCFKDVSVGALRVAECPPKLGHSATTPLPGGSTVTTTTSAPPVQGTETSTTTSAPPVQGTETSTTTSAPPVRVKSASSAHWRSSMSSFVITGLFVFWVILV